MPRPPSWLSAPATAGTLADLQLPSALSAPLPVRLWQPEGLRRHDSAPLLWCHDGRDYVERAALLQWAGSHIQSGSLPAFRMALADPRRRNQWYSGSTRYLRSVDRALAALREEYAIERPLAVMGASLGGLTSMLVALRRPDVGAVLSQSGSFWLAGGAETGWRWFSRVVRHADGIRAGAGPARRGDLLVAMTCGRKESNLAGNRAMVAALRRAGLDVTWRAVAGGHDYPAWRDALDPIWSSTLRRIWS